MQDVRNSIYRLRDRLVRIWSYLPVLWRVRDFDWTSAFHVLEHQLSRIEHCIKSGHGARKEKDVQRIKVVRECLRRLAEDKLAEKEFDEWHERFKGQDILSRLSRERTPEEKRLFKIACDKEQQTRKLLEDLLFNTMRTHYKSWWD